MIRPYASSPDRQTIALGVIGWIVSDPGRAGRFLSLTGLDPGQLRSGLTQSAVQSAALDHILAHEADLIACAEAIGLSPAVIVQAAGR